jgi:Matrixin
VAEFLGWGLVKHRPETFEPLPAADTGADRGILRPSPAVRVIMLVLALIWTQFPLGGGARAEGGHELALCCAWGKAMDDGRLSYSVAATDHASADVIRQAVREWDANLPGLELVEGAVGGVDIAITFDAEPGRTEGQAVTSFTQAGLIRRVDIGIQGGPAPGNAGGLLQIAKHEFGHALGLGHANFEGNLMSKAVSPQPQPLEPCVISAVLEANHWRLADLGLRDLGRPERPRVSGVSC